MEVRRKNDAVRHENSPVCVAYEYGLPTTKIDSAVIELSGRYPDDGWALNTACTALVYVVKGEGKVIFPKGETHLAEGGQILISPNEKYAFDGTMELLFSSTPAWSPDQARHLEN